MNITLNDKERAILELANNLIDNNTGANLEKLKVVLAPALKPNERVLLVGKDMYEHLKNQNL